MYGSNFYESAVSCIFDRLFKYSIDTKIGKEYLEMILLNSVEPIYWALAFGEHTQNKTKTSVWN